MANALLQMILVTYELIGQPISDAAAKAILAELRTYPKADVMDALMRCQKELHKLTLADILDRIPSGHPKVEEAWALVAQSLDNEDISLVWTNEMAMACGAARLLREDKVAARMAFKEVYTEAVNKARAKNSETNSIAKTTGADISCSSPQPSSAKWSGMCHNAHISATYKVSFNGL